MRAYSNNGKPDRLAVLHFKDKLHLDRIMALHCPEKHPDILSSF